MNVLVLGVGNILLSDEGIGVRAVERLERTYAFPDGVELLDGGTAGMELLPIMAGRDLVIIIDAVNTGERPGTRVRLAGEDVPAFFRTRISPHQVGIADVLATLTLTGELPREIVILGVVPASFETGLELTPVLSATLPWLVDEVTAELRRRAVAVRPRAST